jgi:hypothetical protein
VVAHLEGEVGAEDRLDPRVVLDLFRVVQLTAERAAIDQNGAEVHPGGIEAGGEARGTTADDDHVEELCHVLVNPSGASTYSRPVIADT